MDFTGHEDLKSGATAHESERDRWARILAPQPSRKAGAARQKTESTFEDYALAVVIGVFLAVSLIAWWA